MSGGDDGLDGRTVGGCVGNATGLLRVRGGIMNEVIEGNDWCVACEGDFLERGLGCFRLAKEAPLKRWNS